MKSTHIDQMKNGWLIGNFKPSAVESSLFEMAVRRYEAGHIEADYCFEKAYVAVVILKGGITADGRYFPAITAILFEPGDLINFTVKEAATVVFLIYGEKYSERKCNPSLKLETVVTQYDEIEHCFPQVSLRKYNNFDTRKITVVIQGGIDKILTPVCVKSIRRFMPGATIILSTWEHERADFSGYDKIIFSRDPGAFSCSRNNRGNVLNNTNRQLVSTQKGLQEAHTEYTLKIRSDMILTSAQFLNYFEDTENTTGNYAFFRSKVLIPELFSREKLEYYDRRGVKQCIPTPFHPSDWFMFGRTEDLRLYFLDIPVLSRAELGEYHFKNPKRYSEYGYLWTWRYAPEQSICMKALKKRYNQIEFADSLDWNQNNITASSEFMAGNFIILNQLQHRMCMKKYESFVSDNNGVTYSENYLLTNHKLR